MKLLKPSTCSTETIKVKGYSSLLARTAVEFVTGTRPPKTDTHYSGRRLWSRCHIQYDFTIPDVAFAPGSIMNKTDVVFGAELYQGVLPLSHLGNNVYECSVDNIVPITVGTVEVSNGS